MRSKVWPGEAQNSMEMATEIVSAQLSKFSKVHDDATLQAILEDDWRDFDAALLIIKGLNDSDLRRMDAELKIQIVITAYEILVDLSCERSCLKNHNFTEHDIDDILEGIDNGTYKSEFFKVESKELKALRRAAAVLLEDLDKTVFKNK